MWRRRNNTNERPQNAVETQILKIAWNIHRSPGVWYAVVLKDLTLKWKVCKRNRASNQCAALTLFHNLRKNRDKIKPWTLICRVSPCITAHHSSATTHNSNRPAVGPHRSIIQGRYRAIALQFQTRTAHPDQLTNWKHSKKTNKVS